MNEKIVWKALLSKTAVIKLDRCPLVEQLFTQQLTDAKARKWSSHLPRMPLSLQSKNKSGSGSNNFSSADDDNGSIEFESNDGLTTPAKDDYKGLELLTPTSSPDDDTVYNKENALKTYANHQKETLSKNAGQKRKLEEHDSSISSDVSKKSQKLEGDDNFVPRPQLYVSKAEAGSSTPSTLSTPKVATSRRKGETPTPSRRSERTRTPVVLGKDFITGVKGMKKESLGNGSNTLTMSPEKEKENWPNVKLFKEVKKDPKKAKTKFGSGLKPRVPRKGEVMDKHLEQCQECKEGGLLLCCKTCDGVYHLHCINPPLKEVPPKTWQCPVCTLEPLEYVVSHIINWRWLQSRKVREKYEKLSLEKRKLLERPEREYFVRWHDLSYWHCSWVTHAQMKFYHAMKLLTLSRRLENDSYLLEPELEAGDDEDPLYEIYYKYGVRPPWLQVQRIINHRKVSGDNQYLVKWREVPYTQATWEVEGDEQIPEFNKHQEIYHEWRSAFNAVPGKSLNLKHVFIPPKKPRVNVEIEYEGQPPFVDTAKGLRLHDYQIESLNWLRKSWSQGVNTILGDEMGLGKTIQAIIFLYSLFKEGHESGPFLVTAPLSTILNWEREFELWAPDLYVVTYNGFWDNRSLIREHEFSFKKGAVRGGNVVSKVTGPVKFNVLLTSYEMISKDRTCLTSIPWSALIVDEAHRLKNKNSQFFNDLFCYEAKYKLLLTGTPLQNNVEELLNMLTFLCPENVEKYASLEQELENDNIGNEEAVSNIKEILEQRMLRRVKEDVLQNLPAKAEYIVKVELSPLQKQFYKFILTKNFEALNSRKGGHFATLMAIFVELQKLCNHPYLFSKAMMEAPLSANGNYELNALVAVSGKLSLLQKMLRALKKGGNRVLIFSHSTKMLDILEDFLMEQNYGFERIDGSITGTLRQDAIDRFNEPGSKLFVFLLSTKAGGLGINLATADTVILYDSDWNPHNDMQALSRAHRIGQKNQVMVYRLISRNSIEERVAQVARRKLMLSHVVLENGHFDGHAALNRNELEDIIRCGTEGLFQEDNDDIRDDFSEEAIRDLLDRSKSSFDKKQNLADMSTSDFFSAVKVVSYTTKKLHENEAGGSAPKEENQDPDFWKKLLAAHCEPKVEGPVKPLGKGQRERKQIEYNEYNSDDDDEFLVKSDDDDDDEFLVKSGDDDDDDEMLVKSDDDEFLVKD